MRAGIFAKCQKAKLARFFVYSVGLRTRSPRCAHMVGSVDSAGKAFVNFRWHAGAKSTSWEPAC